MTTPLLRDARVAGALYLVTHVTSVLAVVATGDGTDPWRLRTGVALEFVLALACVGTGVLLLPVLRQFGATRAMTFALLRTLEASVILAGTLPMLAGAFLGSMPPAFLELHAASFLVGQGLVIGVNTIVLGSVLLGSGLVPRALAILGLAGGAIVLASDLAQLLGLLPLNGPIAAAAAVPIFAFEIWFAITLLVGPRRLRTGPVTA